MIADIHFQWKYAVMAIEAGCAGVRINPGNIKKHDKVALLGRLAPEGGGGAAGGGGRAVRDRRHRRQPRGRDPGGVRRPDP